MMDEPREANHAKGRSRELERACELCQGTGWKPVRVGEVERVVPCDHGAAAAPAGGFESISDVLERLKKTGVVEDVDQAIAAQIAQRQGAEQPITIAELAEKLWPEEWSDLKKQPSIERGIKAAVARLRLNGRLLIGSSRQRPYGYYMIQNRAELDENREHSRAHLVAWARQFRTFDPDGQEARRLYGELALELGVKNSEL